MDLLRKSPYLLVQGDIVKVRVQARNTNDWGEISEMNTEGAIISV